MMRRLDWPTTLAASTYSLVFSAHHFAAHQAKELDPALEGKGQDQVGKPGPKKGHHANGKDQKRESQQQIGKAREDVVQRPR